MFKDTAHTAEEFANFPWDQLNDEWFEKVGGFSIGGITAGVDFNGPPHKWTIHFMMRTLIKTDGKYLQC